MAENVCFHMMTLFIPFLAFVVATYSTYLYQNDRYFAFEQSFNLEHHIAPMSKGKVIVITGANSGVGFASAKLLAQAGTAQTVIMACRNMGKCQKAKEAIMKEKSDNSDLKLVPAELDLESLTSIKNFASNVQTILRELKKKRDDVNTEDHHHRNEGTDYYVPKIDVLLNNAGIMGVDYSLSNETNVEMHMHVNHLGHFALTSLLRDNLIQGNKERGGSRVVTVSSLMGALPVLNFQDINFVKSPIQDFFRRHMKGFQSFYAYAASKRANLIFTYALNERFAALGITATSAHPGYTRTSIMSNGWSHMPSWLKHIAAIWKFGSMSIDDGALAQLRAALSSSDDNSDGGAVQANDYIGPLFFTAGRPVVVGNSVSSFHHLVFGRIHDPSTVAEDLWKFSEDAIGWKFHNDTSIPIL